MDVRRRNQAASRGKSTYVSPNQTDITKEYVFFLLARSRLFYLATNGIYLHRIIHWCKDLTTEWCL